MPIPQIMMRNLNFLTFPKILFINCVLVNLVYLSLTIIKVINKGIIVEVT